ncbi:deaminase reductase [Terrihabitans soli]|uniref:Deaminase reductase n=1 Tax=Terrihabitans soli TaxID=708113 RepID=A0A6S6QNM5_9HYPH|nr:deaminase reductase [Terrihabitans soli]
MAKLVFGMNRSLDGHVGHTGFAPIRDYTHWDDEHPEWNADEREIKVGSPTLAQNLTELGLIDEYRIYLHPVVIDKRKRYLVGPRPRPRPRLRLVTQTASESTYAC